MSVTRGRLTMRCTVIYEQMSAESWRSSEIGINKKALETDFESFSGFGKSLGEEAQEMAGSWLVVCRDLGFVFSPGVVTRPHVILPPRCASALLSRSLPPLPPPPPPAPPRRLPRSFLARVLLPTALGPDFGRRVVASTTAATPRTGSAVCSRWQVTKSLLWRSTKSALHAVTPGPTIGGNIYI